MGEKCYWRLNKARQVIVCRVLYACRMPLEGDVNNLRDIFFSFYTVGKGMDMGMGRSTRNSRNSVLRHRKVSTVLYDNTKYIFI